MSYTTQSVPRPRLRPEDIQTHAELALFIQREFESVHAKIDTLIRIMKESRGFSPGPEGVRGQ